MEECEKTLQELILKKMNSENMSSNSPMSTQRIVYVLSRIKNLANCIRETAASLLREEIAVIDLPVPVGTNILDLDISITLTAKIVVIDPILLAENYQTLPVLKWAHSTWAGVECLFTSMEKKPEFIMTRHGGEEFANLIAEYVLGQVLNCERGFIPLYLSQDQKKWCDDVPAGRTLEEITISILGAGNMAQAIARCFKAHGTKVIALARTTKKEKVFSKFDRVTFCLEKAIECCDYIINTLPHTSLTAGMLNGEVLSGCLTGPIFINVGRGSIIDESSLINAIESNWIAEAVLDVFHDEPLPLSSRLWDEKKVFITPHCAAVSRPDHVAKSFVAALRCYTQVLPLPNVVDWEAGY